MIDLMGGWFGNGHGPKDSKGPLSGLEEGTGNAILARYLPYQSIGAEVVKLRSLRVSFCSIWNRIKQEQPNSFSQAVFAVVVAGYGEAWAVISEWLGNSSPENIDRRCEVGYRYYQHLSQPLPGGWDQANDWIRETDAVIDLIQKEARK